MDANISRTRPACSFAALPFSVTVKPNLMEVWLQNACEQFVITWDCYCLPAWQVVSVLAQASLGLFVLTALGGVVINLRYHTKQLALPKGLIVGHALLAVVAYGLLLLALFGS